MSNFYDYEETDPSAGASAPPPEANYFDQFDEKPAPAEANYFDQFDEQPAPAAAASAEANYFDQFDEKPTPTTPGTKPPEAESQLKAGFRKFVHDLPGALGGAAAGAAAGGAGGSIAGWPGMLGGALVGGVIGGIAGESAKDVGLKMLGIAESEAAQLAVNAKEHPWTTAGASAATAVVGGTPGAVGKGVRALSGVVGGGFETGRQIVQGEEIDPVKIGANVAGGAIFAKNYPWQDRLSARGAAVGAKIRPHENTAHLADPAAAETPPASNSNPGPTAAGGTVEAHVPPDKNAAAEAAVGDPQNKPTGSEVKYAKKRSSATGDEEGVHVRGDDDIDVTVKSVLDSENVKAQPETTPPAAETPPPTAEPQSRTNIDYDQAAYQASAAQRPPPEKPPLPPGETVVPTEAAPAAVKAATEINTESQSRRMAREGQKQFPAEPTPEMNPVSRETMDLAKQIEATGRPDAVDFANAMRGAAHNNSVRPDSIDFYRQKLTDFQARVADAEAGTKPVEDYSIRNMLRDKQPADLDARIADRSTPEKAGVSDILQEALARSSELTRRINDAGWKVDDVVGGGKNVPPEIAAARQELSMLGGQVSRLLNGLKPRKGRDVGARMGADMATLRKDLDAATAAERQTAPEQTTPSGMSERGREKLTKARASSDAINAREDARFEEWRTQQEAAAPGSTRASAGDYPDMPDFLQRNPKPPIVAPEPAPAVGREIAPTPKEAIAARAPGETVSSALKKARTAEESGGWRAGGPTYPHADLSRPKLEKLIKEADAESSRLTKAMIDAGRGHERPTDIRDKTDQLSMDKKAVTEWQRSLNEEAKRRMKGHGKMTPLDKSYRHTFYGGENLQQSVIERGRSGRPLKTEPLPIGNEQAVLEHGAKIATGEIPPTGPQPPEIQAARRKGTVDDRLKARNAAAKEYEAALEDRIAGKVDDAVVAGARARYEAAKAAVAAPARGQPSVTSPVGGGVPPGGTAAAAGGAGVPPGGAPPPTGTTPPTSAPPPPAQGTGSAQSRIQSRIVSASKPWWSNVPKTREEFRDMLDDIYTKTKAEFHPLVRLETKGGVPLSAEESFSVLARLTKGNTGRTEQKFKHHQYDIETRQRTGKAFEEILAPVKEDMQGFTNYAVAQHAIELNNRNIETGITTADARQTVAQGATKYQTVFRDLVDFQDQELTNLVKSGLISQDAATKMRALNKAYVPYYRLMDETTGMGQDVGAGLKVRKPTYGIEGSERHIIDPIDSIIRNTYAFTHLAERNLTLRALKNWADNHPQGNTFMQRVMHPEPVKVSADEINGFLKSHGLPASIADDMTVFRPAAHRDRPGEIRLFEDGKAKYYKVDKPVAEAITAMDRETLGMLTKIMATPARMLRAGAVLSPEFLIRNPVRDQFAAFIQSKHGYIPVYDMVKGLGHLLRQDDTYQNWLKHGGANATLTSLDRKMMNIDPKDMVGKVKNVITSPIQALRAISDMTENATRLGEYQRAIKGGASPTEAAFASREVIDFARIGSKTKGMNAVIPFMNAQLEGVDRAARAFNENKLAFTMKAATSITMPSVLLWMANKDDPRYRELPQWEKDLFWIVPTDKWVGMDAQTASAVGDAHKRQLPNGEWQRNNGTIWRIPKPFELGILFGTLPERALDAFFTSHPNAFKGFGKTMLHAFTPGVIPQALIPPAEQFANKSIFRDAPLVPKRLEDVDPKFQSTQYTSETAKKLGSAIASVNKDTSFASPIIIDNYIKQFTGGLGTHAVSAIDKVIDYGKPKAGPAKPEATFADMPGIKALVSRHPSGSAQSIKDFYETYNERKGTKATNTMLRKAGRADEIEGDSAPQQLAKGVHKQLGIQNKLIRSIYQDGSMTPTDKRRLIDETYLRMIETARRGNEIFKQTARP